jgi:tRNA A37 threonylcarbamoyladenosine dehydratase
MEILPHPADSIDLERAFGGVIRLYGRDGFERIRAAHGIVVGIGGVGSWAAEALARSGLGRITMIDMDVVVESNLNRQAHATVATLGANKVDAMRARIQSFAPSVQVDVVDDFLTPDNVGALIPSDTAFVIDAADKMRAKVAMVLHCLSQKIPLITCGSAGGKSDASRLMVDDLTFTEQDALLAKLRVDLRQNHGFPRGKKEVSRCRCLQSRASGASADWRRCGTGLRRIRVGDAHDGEHGDARGRPRTGGRCCGAG